MIKIGTKVIHSKKPEWGNGRIKDLMLLDDGKKILSIYFQNYGTRKYDYKIAIESGLIEGEWPTLTIPLKYEKLLNPCLGYYKNKELIKSKDDFTDELFRIKNMSEDAIIKYVHQVLSLLKFKTYQKYLKNSVICVVPSSNKEKTMTGIIKFAEYLLKKSSLFIDGIHLLNRSETIPANSTSNQRASTEDHLRTINVERQDVIKNKTCFLIDDISTTGISLKACKSILKKSGATEVITMSLGQTVLNSEYENNPDHEARKKQSDYFQQKLDSLKDD